MLHGAGADPRFAPRAALPQSGGPPGHAHKEPDRGPADGNRDRVRQEGLHGKAYFRDLLGNLRETPESVLELLKASRGQVEFFEATQRRLLKMLHADTELRERVARLQSIRGVGEIVALTWALETGEASRFPSIDAAVSYCGLTSPLRESAGKQQRGPLSKQRNAHLQTVLIEAAKLAPRYNPQLAELYERESLRGNANQAAVAVARKLVAYLLAVDRSLKPFQARTSAPPAPEAHAA